MAKDQELLNLFRLVNGLRYFGAGCKVTRNIYKFPNTYWIVKRVKLSRDQDHGKVWGRLVWRGRPQPYDREIHSARKHQWEMVCVPNYASFKGKPENYDNLVSEAQEWFDKNGEWVHPHLKDASEAQKKTSSESTA